MIFLKIFLIYCKIKIISLIYSFVLYFISGADMKIYLKTTLFIIFFILSICISSNLFAVDTSKWDIYYGPKGALGYGGSMLEIGLNEISPNDFSMGITKQDKRGKFVFNAGFAANFIIRDNWGMEYELLYRRAGERVHDINGDSHSLNMHYIDLNMIGKYWLFGKLLAAGVGIGISYLPYAEIDGINVMYNMNKIDISAIIKMSFNYWAVSQNIVVSLELTLVAGFLNTLKNDGNLNNIAVFISFGIYYLHKTTGIQLSNFRY